MIDAEVKRLRELCDRATPGPWDGRNWQTHLGLHNSDAADHRVYANKEWIAEVGHANNRTANTQFIAAARTALPKLLDEREGAIEWAEEMEKERDEVRAEVQRLKGLASRLGVLAGEAFKIIGPTDSAVDMVAELARICDEAGI